MSPSFRLLFNIFLCFLIGSGAIQAQTTLKAPADSVAPAPPTAPLAPTDDPGNGATKAYADKLIPASPDVAALGKYVDIPVNNYTGTPNISIPLYTIKTRDLELPLSLNYHGSGIRVEEEASSVGLGWSLSSGGVVQHSIRGRDDFLDVNADNWRTLSTTVVQGSSALCYFYQNENAVFFVPNNQPAGEQLSNTLYNLYQTIDGERYDSERDIFSFSFPGHSGKFVIEPLGNGQYSIRQLPQSDLRITLLNNDLTGDSGFVITASDGTRYTFSQREIQQSHFTLSPRDTGKKYHPTTPAWNPTWGSSATPDVGFNTWKTATGAWYLTEIQSQKGDIITLSYSITANYIHYLPVRNESYTTNGQTNYRWNASETRTKLVYPQTITFDNGTVTFTTTTRDDLPAGANRITGLDVKSSTGSTVRKYQLNQDYFDSGSGAYSFVAKRLKLQSVQDITGGNCVPAYSFNYEETANLPNKDSYAQDYWGFYNGATAANDGNTGTMLPPVVAGQYHLPFPGANRTPNASYMRANALTKITYPTGGTAEFDFQPHVSQNLYYNPSDHYYIRVTTYTGGYSLIGGGLRINTIKTISATGVTQTTTYDYTYSNTISSGKLMANLQFADWVYPSQNSFELQYSSSPRYPMGIGAQGNSVGYSSVKVYRGTTQASEGYSIFTYMNEPDAKAADFCIQQNAGTLYDLSQCGSQSNQAYSPALCDPYGRTQFSYYDGVNDPAVPNYIYTLNGSLLFEEHYNSSNALIKQTVREYEVVNRVRVNNFRVIKRSNIYSGFVYYTDSEWPRITKSISNDYGAGANATLFTSTTTTYGYNSTGAHKQAITLTTTDKSGESVVITRSYAPDVNPTTAISTGLISLNLLAVPLQESKELIKVNSTTVAVGSTRTTYNRFGSSWLVPQTIESQVGSGPFITQATFEYSAGGDVSALTGRDDIRTTFGYYSGGGKTALPQSRIVNAGQASAQQTTYDYVPLVGLSTTTDAKGLVTTYAYDGYNRLMAIRDGGANLLKTFDYRYASSGCSTKSAGLPDLTPTIDINTLTFGSNTGSVDFVVNLYEINNLSTSGPITFSLPKLSAFSISYPTTNGTSATFGNPNIENANWSFSETANFITVTSKAGVSIAAGGQATIGFSVVRKMGVSSGTRQHLTASINSSGEELNPSNNIVVTSLTTSN